MTRDIGSWLDSAGLSHHAAAIQRLTRHSVLIKCAPASGQVPLGGSKLGGLPDLPPRVAWPRWKDQPLAFIGQIRMDDIAPHDMAGLLPKSGILWFFYGAEQRAWGFDPAHRDGWRVLFYDGPDSALARQPAPVFAPAEGFRPPDLVFAECRADFSAAISPPNWDSTLLDPLKLSEKEDEAYMELLERLAAHYGSNVADHHLLGYPGQIQGDMPTECQLASQGLYCGDSRHSRDPRREELEKGAGDWILLLQVDSDDRLGTQWGDVGRIYYWIRKADLTARVFEAAWCILQCY